MLQIFSYHFQGRLILIMNPGDRLVHHLRYFLKGHLAPDSQQDNLTQMRRQRLQYVLSLPGVNQIVRPRFKPHDLPVQELPPCLSSLL
jgi:hypothetical protein